MIYLSIHQVLELHQRIMDEAKGDLGILDLNALESALAQPRVMFSGKELYPTIIEKASALGFSIIKNHLVDGNKRTGHAAMEVFLLLNGFEVSASINEQEKTILQLAAGKLSRDGFTAWLKPRIKKKGSG